MHPTFRVTHLSTTAHPPAADVLGAHHPLVRDLERLDVARNQFLIVAGMLAGGVDTLLAHSAAGTPLVVAAAVVELLIACRIALIRESRRLRVLELVAEGHAELPIAIVEWTCGRLRAAPHRQRLVRSIETLLDPRPGSFDDVVTPWQFARTEFVVGAREELKHIAGLLRGSDAQVEGVALMELLLSDGTSRLHGDDPQALREELGRVRFLLEARSHGAAVRLPRSCNAGRHPETTSRRSRRRRS